MKHELEGLLRLLTETYSGENISAAVDDLFGRLLMELCK